ncbi:LysE family transporter [Cronobacter turicensis]|uniref:LysE family transporter n=1 Tax=Cronobacter turicensis TaxID=413502 RepID=UPI0014126440|nr:LysE family transporter [Cronobacter turicensis]NHV65069.1 LysE family transporter [Cronobacter turicensis]NHW12010.1 LysE family transporter [Cronobacter turicensis]
MDISGFVLAIAPVALSPGASFTLAMNNVIHRGITGVFSVIAGTLIGIYIHASLVGLGVTQVLVRYPPVMKTLQLTGTLYLLWLALRLVASGIQAWRRPQQNTGHGAGVKEALLANLFNIKAILLWLTVVPAFAGTAFTHYLLLASIHVAIMASWLLLCGGAIVLTTRRFSVRWLKVVVDTGGGLFLFILTLSSVLALLK